MHEHLPLKIHRCYMQTSNFFGGLKNAWVLVMEKQYKSVKQGKEMRQGLGGRGVWHEGGKDTGCSGSSIPVQ